MQSAGVLCHAMQCRIQHFEGMLSNPTAPCTSSWPLPHSLSNGVHTGHAYTDVPAVSGLVVKDPLMEGTASSAVLAQLSGQVTLGGIPVTLGQGRLSRITCKTDSA